MDNRIASLEAEKEQYDLENKSLINKLKVSGVKQQELDDAKETQDELKEPFDINIFLSKIFFII